VLEPSRRELLRLGIFFGITASLVRTLPAGAEQVYSGPGEGSWLSQDGQAKYRWDAVRKVTGQKIFARDFRAKDLEGWPQQQANAFLIKATRADRTFEGVDLSRLGTDLQPDRLLYNEDLEADGISVPMPPDLGFQFFGAYFLVPRGRVPPNFGHPVALLIYKDFDRFELAKRQTRFADNLVLYGEAAPPNLPPNYGAARYVRIEGQTPGGPPEFSPMQDSVIWGGFNGNTPTWPSEAATGIFVPQRVAQRSRGSADLDPLAFAQQNWEPMRRGMAAADKIATEIEAAKADPAKLVLTRNGFSQSIDPCALEPDNGNCWYDAATRTLHMLVSTQSPSEVARVAAFMMKDNKRFPVEHIELLSGSTVGYGSKDQSVFPFYSIVAALYGDGLPVRLANDRFEQFQLGMKRHAIDMEVTLVVDRRSGRFETLKGVYTCNGGGRANSSFSVAQVAATAAQSMYYFPKSDLACSAIATQAVEAGSMRGYGTIQAMSITELMVDEVAAKLGIDPIDLRKTNALLPGYANTQGAIQVGDPRLIEMLDRAAHHPIWQDRASKKVEFEASNPGLKYGVGFAQVQKEYGTGADTSALQLEFDAQGRLSMRHCVQEIGTGATTAQQVMVRDVLGVAPADVVFGVTEFDALPLVSNWMPFTTTQAQQDELQKDPYWVPFILPSMVASNSVYFIGFGTRQAARFLLEHSLWPAAREIWRAGVAGGQIAGSTVTLADVRAVPGGISAGGLEPLPFAHVAAQAHAMGLITGVALHVFSRWEWAQAEFDIPGVGVVRKPFDALAVKYGDGAAADLKARMTTGGYHYLERTSVEFPPVQLNNAGGTTYTPAACLVEASVNTFTGAVEILRHHSIIDPGTVIVEPLVSGQMQGGAAMGIGHALMEELPLYADGPGDGTWNFNRYTIPRSKDVAVWTQSTELLPPLTETAPPKGLGEIVIIPIVAATGNAIAAAINRRFYELPITPEKILRALQ